MRLYFAGTEQKPWRDLLADEGAEAVSLSYIGLLRRIKDPSAWRLEDHYPPWQAIYLDSGCYTLNREGSDTGPEEASRLHRDYLDFVAVNIDRIEFASEFDARVIREETLRARGEFWAGLPQEKFLPVWHAEDGTGELERLAGQYPRAGVLQGDTSGDLAPLLNRLAGRTLLHGVAMTRMESMRAVRWDSVGSTSWISPTQWGDTFVWDGRELHRYPQRYKDRARTRHRSLLEAQGFDTAKIEAGDNRENLRLSVWSWRQFAASIGRDRVTTLRSAPDPPKRETATLADDHRDPPAGNGEVAVPPGKRLLPVLGFSYQDASGEDGEAAPEPHMETPSESLLQCDTCFMRERCPLAEPGSACKYSIPVRVRTAGQLAALHDSMIEMQTQRVLMMRMIEQTEGGYVDGNLSSEIDRLSRLVKTRAEQSKEGFSLKIEASGPSRPGLISGLWGQDVANRVTALPEASTEDIVNGEILDE